MEIKGPRDKNRRPTAVEIPYSQWKKLLAGERARKKQQEAELKTGIEEAFWQAKASLDGQLELEDADEMLARLAKES